MKLTRREMFLAKISRDRATGCWLWQGLVRSDGYGMVRYEDKVQSTHRLAWKLFRGEIKPGQIVCHKCDVRACVNPDHLFLGTALDNARDMVSKGRNFRGEKHRGSKLTTEQVIKIKALLSENKLFIREIAEEFGVSPGTISGIKFGRIWRHVLSPAKEDIPSAHPMSAEDLAS